MTTTVLFGPPAATLKILLDDPQEHDFPAAARIIRDLTPEQAIAVPPGLPYSIARIVAHMHANMQFNSRLIQAADPTQYKSPFELWPAVTAADWPALVEEFLAILEALARIAEGEDLDRVLYPATSDQPAWTLGYKLACSVAKHNAYHLGQIAVLRRLVGAPSRGDHARSGESSVLPQASSPAEDP